MNWRAVMIHGGLLVAVLALLWWEPAEPSSPSPGAEAGPILVDAAEGQVTAVTYEDGARTLTLRAEEDDRGRWFRLEGEEAQVKPADPTGEASPEPATRVPVVARAGAAAATLWEGLEPLRALRVLKEVDDAKQVELGLDDPSATLTVAVGDSLHRFSLGGQAFGTMDAYARTESGLVVVLPAVVTRNLSRGSVRFIEKRLLAASRPEISGLVIRWDQEVLRATQRDASDVHKAYWELDDGGDAEALKRWVDGLMGLAAEGWRDGGIAPGAERVFTVDVVQQDRVSETLSLFRQPAGDGDARWWVISDHGRLPASVSAASAAALTEGLAGLRP